MADPILRLDDLVKNYGALVATDHVTLDVVPGEIHALIGPNGAGKTTLVNQVAGEIKSNAGRISFLGHDITDYSVNRRTALGIGRTFQITQIFQELTVLENVLVAVQAAEGRSTRFGAAALADVAGCERASELLDFVGLAAAANAPASSLGHGRQKQLDLAIALASRPKLLLLDEPLAGMGKEDSKAMVDLLLRMKGQFAMLLIEHDMGAVFALADRVSVLVYGKRIATGAPAEIRANPEVRVAYLGEDAA